MPTSAEQDDGDEDERLAGVAAECVRSSELIPAAPSRSRSDRRAAARREDADLERVR